MIEKRVKQTVLYQLMDIDKDSWFDIKSHRYVQSIDTFYYSILLQDDPENLKRFDKIISILKVIKETVSNEAVQVYELDPMFYMNGYTVGMYKYDLEVKDEFLYLISNTKLNKDTPEIIVQLRSYTLWTNGLVKAYEKSFKMINDVLQRYDVKIAEVKENRIDYCWHTNAIQNPKRYFDIKNIAQQRVGRLVEFDMHGIFKGDFDYEVDYLRLGRLKSNNIIFRTYNKSKEVVEMAYKSWFFKIWQLSGLINRYDFYCLESAYLNNKWSYVDKARLRFYLEHVENIEPLLRQKIENMITIETDHDQIAELANALTPEVTLIINVEYMTKRKFYQNMEKVNFNKRTGYDKELRIALDSLQLYVDYLTHDILRFVDPTTNERKGRCEYTNFWKRLRDTKVQDAPIVPKDIKVIRNYKSNMDLKNIKMNIIKSTAYYNVLNGKVNDDILYDSLDLVTDLNDNDIYHYKRYVQKKIHQHKIDESTLTKTESKLLTYDLVNKNIIANNNQHFNLDELKEFMNVMIQNNMIDIKAD